MNIDKARLFIVIQVEGPSSRLRRAVLLYLHGFPAQSLDHRRSQDVDPTSRTGGTASTSFYGHVSERFGGKILDAVVQADALMAKAVVRMGKALLLLCPRAV